MNVHCTGHFVSEDESVILLAIAVLNQAQIDFERALTASKKNRNDYKSRDEAAFLQKFFLSQYGQALSFGHGEAIVEQCKRHVAAGRIAKRSNKI